MFVIVTQMLIEHFRATRVFFENTEAMFRLRVGERLTFADDASIEPYCGILAGHSIPSMGSFSYSWSPLPAEMRVGRYCSIAPGMTVPVPRHTPEYVSTSPFLYDRHFSIMRTLVEDSGAQGYDTFLTNPQKPWPIIGNDVWIGANVTLLPGIRVGDGAVVAAGTVVVKDVPDYAIIGGNPGRVIRSRFPERLVGRFQQAAWWRHKFSDFAGMQLSDPERFLDELASRQLPVFAPEPVVLRELPGAGH